MKALLLTLLAAAALFAQESVSRVLQLKYIHPDNAAAILSVMSANKVRYQADTGLRIIALNGPQDLVDAIVAAVGKIDVPTPAAPNIELTFHMLLASPQGEAGHVPADLNGVAQQLRTVFNLKSVRVLETAVFRAREGKSGETSGGMAPPSKSDLNALYNIAVKRIGVNNSEKGAVVRLDGLRFVAKIPYVYGNNTSYAESVVVTDIDVREGQKVVVGKTSIDSASQSIFLVVTAKLVD